VHGKYCVHLRDFGSHSENERPGDLTIRVDKGFETKAAYYSMP